VGGARRPGGKGRGGRPPPPHPMPRSPRCQVDRTCRELEERGRPRLARQWARAAPPLLAGYGVSVAGFLGGAHWGHALRGSASAAVAGVSGPQLVWGVAPGLLALPATVLAACPDLRRRGWDQAVVAATLLLAAQADVAAALKGRYPRGLLGLRIPLTLVAVGSLATGAAWVVERETAARAGARAGGGPDTVSGTVAAVRRATGGKGIVVATEEAEARGWTRPRDWFGWLWRGGEARGGDEAGGEAGRA